MAPRGREVQSYRDAMVEEHGEFTGSVGSVAQVDEVNCKTLQEWIRKVENGNTNVSDETIAKLEALGYKNK